MPITTRNPIIIQGLTASAHPMQQRAVPADTTLQPPPKKTEHRRDNKLDNYFTPRAARDARPEIEELRIPDVATDVSSTYLRLHAKRHIYAEDEDFRIVKDALSQLRGFVNQKRLHDMTTDPPKTSKTIRQDFKENRFKTIAFDVSKSLDEATGAQEGKAARHTVDHSHTWRTYYVKSSSLRKRGTGCLLQSDDIIHQVRN